MFLIPMFSSTILLLAFIFLSVDGRSTSPWNRRRPNFTARTPSTSNALDRLMLPQIRGGDSDSTSSSGFSSALPTPISPRIGDSDETTGEGGDGHEAKTPTYNIHPSITGGHILRAGKVDPEDRLKNPPSLAKKNTANNATSTEVVVDTYVTKKDKATKKLLKRHKQIAKKLKVRSHNIIMTALTLRFKETKGLPICVIRCDLTPFIEFCLSKPKLHFVISSLCSFPTNIIYAFCITN